MVDDKAQRKTLSFVFWLFVSLTFAFWAGRFWLKPFVLFGHSAFIDYLRQLCFDKAVRSGVLYPRWIEDFYFGYGSPIFNFYAPFFYVFSEFFRLFDLSVLQSLNIARFIIFLLAGAGMYLLARTYCSGLSATVVSLLYVFSNYFLVNSYIRVASGELLALALAPYLLLTLIRVFRASSFFRVLLFSLVFALLIISHNISALLWAIFVIGFGLWLMIWDKNLKSFSWVAFGFALALAFSAFFWVPAFFEKNLVYSEKSLTEGYFDYRKHFVYVDQLFKDEWGYGISREGRGDTMPVSCGRILLVGWLVGLGAILTKSRSKKDEGRERWFFALSSVLSLFMVLSVSGWLWELIPLLKFIQFPWRFYLLFTPLSVITLSIGLGIIEEHDRILSNILALVIAIGIFVLQSPRVHAYRAMLDVKTIEPVRVPIEEPQKQTDLVEPQEFFNFERIRQLGITTTARHDYLPIWVKMLPNGVPKSFLEVTGGARATILEQNYNYFNIFVESDIPSELVLNVFYFPGWTAKRDGRKLKVKPEEVSGRLLIELEKGAYEIDVYFGSDLLRTTGWALSVCALICCAVVLIFGRTGKRLTYE